MLLHQHNDTSDRLHGVARSTSECAGWLSLRLEVECTTVPGVDVSQNLDQLTNVESKTVAHNQNFHVPKPQEVKLQEGWG